jgi:hypothetical protein
VNQVAVVAALAGVVVAVVAVAVVLLRRSLFAVAFGIDLGALGLALAAGAAGRPVTAAVIVAAGVAGSVVVAASAVAVYRRRGADFVDELRELGGG